MQTEKIKMRRADGKEKPRRGRRRGKGEGGKSKDCYCHLVAQPLSGENIFKSLEGEVSINSRGLKKKKKKNKKRIHE